jgi:glycosyltransferase involved in cell wall biosynthesis
MIQYIEDQDITDIFSAADFVLLTYSRDFVSASGVLNVAVECGKPVLASGGDGPLKTAVAKYPIGNWIESLDASAIASTVQAIIEKKMPFFNFMDYLKDHSWERNAQTVRNAIIFGANED